MRHSLRCERGYTLVELMIVFVVVVALFWAVLVPIMAIKNNLWFTNTGVMMQLKGELDNDAVEFVRSEANFNDYSVITVRIDGQLQLYCLDTDVFYLYELFDCASR
ncbi:TPA: hypothetical protein DF272_01765 [Candidatus Falkowbacteria bacterium]|nr:hypothetical protein [Candidatus Falkowbacteria bacterium]